jgi:hypothetical protein
VILITIGSISGLLIWPGLKIESAAGQGTAVMAEAKLH